MYDHFIDYFSLRENIKLHHAQNMLICHSYEVQYNFHYTYFKAL